MIKHVTRILVAGKSPVQISHWLLNLNRERYLKWHTAHRDYKQIKMTRSFIGSIIYFDETIEGFRINFKWKVVKLERNKLLVMKAHFFYPICLRISLKELNGNTEVLHELQIGVSFYGLAKILDTLVGFFIFTNKRANALDRHATEEFKNLESLIE